MDDTKKALSRRQFLKAAAVSAAAGGLGMLAGCGSTPAPAATTGAAAAPTAAVAAPTATRGLQTLRFAGSGTAMAAETLDPAVGLQSMTRICAMYDSLNLLDEGFVPQPMLAESWEPNDKADVWTFKLRKDVAFHDGTKFTAKDVVYTYQRVLDPATASPGSAALAGIDANGIEAPDDYTVVFKLPQPLISLPVVLNTKFTYIIPNGYTAEDIKAKPNGTGPFIPERFVPGEDPTIMVKNPKYWMPDRPRVDVLEMRMIPDATARTAALVRGEVDIVSEVAQTELAALKGNPDITVISQPSGSWDAFIMQVDQPPFDDNRVRLALKYCIDRQQMVDLALGGEGRLANDVPVPSWFEYGIDEPPRAQDIEKAKALLAEAGYANGLDLELWTTTYYPQWPTMATILKEVAAQAGFNINIQMGAADTYYTEIWLKKPFCMTDWSARPADGILSEAFLSTSSWNETNWRRPDWDEVFLKARGTMDYEERKKLYQQAQRMISDEGGCIVPFFWNSLAATRNNVTGYVPQSRYIIYDFSTAGFKS